MLNTSISFFKSRASCSAGSSCGGAAKRRRKANNGMNSAAVTRCLSQFVALHPEGDQTIDQRRVREAARFPHFRIHTDGSKSGNGIDLVDEQFSSCRLQQKIDASHPFALDSLIAGDGEPLNLGGLFGREIG